VSRTSFIQAAHLQGWQITLKTSAVLGFKKLKSNRPVQSGEMSRRHDDDGDFGGDFGRPVRSGGGGRGRGRHDDDFPDGPGFVDDGFQGRDSSKQKLQQKLRTPTPVEEILPFYALDLK
jgi:hypothetical protein